MNTLKYETFRALKMFQKFLMKRYDPGLKSPGTYLSDSLSNSIEVLVSTKSLFCVLFREVFADLIKSPGVTPAGRGDETTE